MSQTQDNLDVTPTLDSDNEDNYFAVSSNELKYRKGILLQNTVFDELDAYLSTEIKVITDYRYLSGIIEFNLEYTNGDTSWNLIFFGKG